MKNKNPNSIWKYIRLALLPSAGFILLIMLSLIPGLFDINNKRWIQREVVSQPESAPSSPYTSRPIVGTSTMLETPPDSASQDAPPPPPPPIQASLPAAVSPYKRENWGPLGESPWLTKEQTDESDWEVWVPNRFDPSNDQLPADLTTLESFHEDIHFKASSSGAIQVWSIGNPTKNYLLQLNSKSETSTFSYGLVEYSPNQRYLSFSVRVDGTWSGYMVDLDSGTATRTSFGQDQPVLSAVDSKGTAVWVLYSANYEEGPSFSFILSQGRPTRLNLRKSHYQVGNLILDSLSHRILIKEKDGDTTRYAAYDMSTGSILTSTIPEAELLDTAKPKPTLNNEGAEQPLPKAPSGPSPLAVSEAGPILQDPYERSAFKLESKGAASGPLALLTGIAVPQTIGIQETGDGAILHLTGDYRHQYVVRLDTSGKLKDARRFQQPTGSPHTNLIPTDYQNGKYYSWVFDYAGTSTLTQVDYHQDPPQSWQVTLGTSFRAEDHNLQVLAIPDGGCVLVAASQYQRTWISRINPDGSLGWSRTIAWPYTTIGNYYGFPPVVKLLGDQLILVQIAANPENPNPRVVRIPLSGSPVVSHTLDARTDYTEHWGFENSKQNRLGDTPGRFAYLVVDTLGYRFNVFTTTRFEDPVALAYWDTFAKQYANAISLAPMAKTQTIRLPRLEGWESLVGFASLGTDNMVQIFNYSKLPLAVSDGVLLTVTGREDTARVFDVTEVAFLHEEKIDYKKVPNAIQGGGLTHTTPVAGFELIDVTEHLHLAPLPPFGQVQEGEEPGSVPSK